jgi:hypothetical protein
MSRRLRFAYGKHGVYLMYKPTVAQLGLGHGFLGLASSPPRYAGGPALFLGRPVKLPEGPNLFVLERPPLPSVLKSLEYIEERVHQKLT